MVSKSKLIELLHCGQTEIDRFVDNLSQAEHDAIGDGDIWSARDVLAHVTEWTRREAADINACDRGEPYPDYTDIDAENAGIVAEYRRLSWDELHERMQQAFQDNLALVERLTDEQLNDPDRYSFMNGRPAWRFIVGNGYSHTLAMHLRPWYLAHGQREYATRLAEDETRRLVALDDAPDWQGVTIYNLGCHYALLGDKDAALEKLATGFQLNPGLKEYAHRDTDLVSLHGDPRFEALALSPVEA